MPPDVAREVGEWRRKAEIDLAAAKALLRGERTFPSVAVFLCQQAAEKMLKVT
jgi:HEPN domain-containing protein